MSRKFPTQVSLDEDEVWRVNRIRIARYYHVLPSAVDGMSLADIDDTIHLMWADEND